MKYAFIQEYRKQFSITQMCGLFKVSRSGFYSFVTSPQSQREQSNQQLDKRIMEIYSQHKKRYGALRITRALQS